MIIVAAIAGLLCLVALHDLLRRPTIRRVALRNLTRRRGEAALVILGSALGTSIIAGALIVGDTFDHSIRDIARTDLGPVDQVVVVDDPDDLAAAVATTNGVAGIDGVATLADLTAAVKAPGADGRGEPTASVAEADLDALRALGGTSTGLTNAGPTPDFDNVVINDDLAATLEVGPGDSIELFAYGMAETFDVQAVVPAVGLAGSTDVFLAPGTIESLGGDTNIGAPTSLVLISLDGDVFDSTANSAEIARTIVTRLDATGISYEFDDAKAELLEDAAAEGSEITSIFTAIGGFSVLAGVLLLVNLFVMLAEERKTALGVLRAVGWRRGHLIRGFTLEGATYGVIAAAIGAVMGIGVGWLTYKVTESIFASTETDFVLRLSVQPSSLLLAALIGLVISLVVVWATSWRISRLNIIRAIKDLPEPPTQRSTRLVAIAGQIGAIAGVGLTVLGYSAESPAALMAGVPLALLALLPLFTRLAGSRIAPITSGIAIIAWSIGVFSLFADIFTDPSITIFLLQGVLLVLGGVLITSSLGTAWSRLMAALPGSGPQTQLGLAYPVARRFRTGISLAMFSLIIFSLTFIAAMSAAFGAKTADFALEASAGHDALLWSNPANPVEIDELLAHPDVADATTVLRGGPDFTAPFEDGGPKDWPISGIDSTFTSLGAPTLFERDPAYGSDIEVFDAVATDPTLTVVSSWFLGDDDRGAPEIGSVITMHNRSGEEHDLTVVGIMQNDWAFAGTFLSADLVRDFLPSEFEPRLHYVSFADDVAASDATAALDGAFIRQGLESETFAKLIDDEVREQQGFFNLLSGYLSLGLVIGVAGLGVVMVRAVRERRQQVGMLRAMGMSSGGVRSIFLTEGAFVALQGVVSGVALGLLSSYQLLTQSNTFEIDLDYVIPVLALAIITLIPLTASAIASAIPAGRAARLPAAEALRLTD